MLFCVVQGYLQSCDKCTGVVWRVAGDSDSETLSDSEDYGDGEGFEKEEKLAENRVEVIPFCMSVNVLQRFA